MAGEIVETSKARAGRITDTIGIARGLVIAPATSRSTELRVYERPDLREWCTSYHAVEEGVEKAISPGGLLANNFDLALLVRCIRGAQKMSRAATNYLQATHAELGDLFAAWNFQIDQVEPRVCASRFAARLAPFRCREVAERALFKAFVVVRQ